MRLRGVLPLILFVCSGFLFSQKNPEVFKVSGMVADEITGRELVKASVAVNSRGDNKTIAGGTTDEKGNFSIENISEKVVRIKFSMMGYQPVVIDSVDLDKTSRLGLIKLRQAAIVLPDVVIKSLKPMIEFQADRQVLNMDRLPGNSGSVTDALKNSGTVEVDPQSKKITVRGQDIKLQMDGHEYPMPSEMLSQLPASMIEQVEIILAPGAKESAEGGTYILNLVSKKTATQDNYSGSISFNTSTTNSNSGGVNLNYKLGKLNLFSQMYGGYYEYSGVSTDERINYLSRSMYHQGSSDHSASYGRSGYFKLGFDYDFDDANSMTAYASYNGYGSEYNNKGETSVWDNTGIKQYRYGDNSLNSYYNNGLSFYGFYKRKFDAKGHELTMNMLYNNMKNPTSSDLHYDYSNRPDRPQLQTSDQGTNAATLIFKADYVYPFSAGRLEAGYNLTFRDRKDNYKVRNYSYTYFDWRDSLGLSNDFKYNETIHALYASYSYKIDKLDIKGGLRMEALDTKGDQITSGDKFTSGFVSLFPNLNLSWKFNDMLQLGFTAFRRVRYPMVYYVNPFKQYYGPNSYSLGNPKLKPTYIYSYAVNLSQYLNMYYVYSTGMFTSASTIEHDSIMVYSFINLDNNKTYGVDVTLPYYNSPMMPFHLPDFINMLNIRYTFNYMERTGRFINENMSYFSRNHMVSGNLGLKLWYDVDMNVSLYYQPRTENKKYKSNGYKYLYISFSKALLDQKLRLNLSVNDVLNTSVYDNESFGDSYYTKSHYAQERSRGISLGLTWMFNDYKERRDRNLDDGRDAGGSGGGQGRGGM